MGGLLGEGYRLVGGYRVVMGEDPRSPVMDCSVDQRDSWQR